MKSCYFFKNYNYFEQFSFECRCYIYSLEAESLSVKNEYNKITNVIRHARIELPDKDHSHFCTIMSVAQAILHDFSEKTEGFTNITSFSGNFIYLVLISTIIKFSSENKSFPEKPVNLNISFEFSLAHLNFIGDF